jgi:hypothetical protein
MRIVDGVVERNPVVDSGGEPVVLGDLDHGQSAALRSEFVVRLGQSLLALEKGDEPVSGMARARGKIMRLAVAS